MAQTAKKAAKVQIRISFPKIADVESGFSVLEVIVFLAIVSLAAAILAPTISSTRSTSEVEAVRAFISRQLAHARLRSAAVVVTADEKQLNVDDATFLLNATSSERFSIEHTSTDVIVKRILAYPDGRMSGGALVLTGNLENLVLIGPESSQE